MAAKDRYHSVVRTSLEKENWVITHDPFPLQAGGYDLEIDLGAERIIAAERDQAKIAVEIKSFLGPSKISAFYGALGQFITYRSALQIQESDRLLYLAIPSDIYDKFFSNLFIRDLMHQNQVNCLTYSVQKETIDRWTL